MNPQVNWQKIRDEFSKLADVNRLRGELNRLTDEFRNFDFHNVLSPSAQEKVKTFEKKYADILKTVHQAQRQVDREFNRVLRQVKGHRLLADMNLEHIRKSAVQQRERLEKVAQDLRGRMQKPSANGGTSPRKAASPKKKAAPKAKASKTAAKPTKKTKTAKRTKRSVKA